MSAHLVQSVGWGVLPVPHHEAARPRPQHVPRLRLCPAVILLRLVLGVDDCNEPGIGGVPEGVVWGVCQQLGGVPWGCDTDSVRGNQSRKVSSVVVENCTANALGYRRDALRSKDEKQHGHIGVYRPL